MWVGEGATLASLVAFGCVCLTQAWRYQGGRRPGWRSWWAVAVIGLLLVFNVAVQVLRYTGRV